MKSSQFVDALTNDIEGTPGASTTVNPVITAEATKPKAASATGAVAGDDEEGDDATASQAAPAQAAAATAVTSVMDEMQEKQQADLAALVEEKEAEIAGMVTVLDGLKAEIGKSEIQAESLQKQKTDLEEEKKDLAENLKTTQKAVKKKKEVVTELAKLSG